jgi:sortase A
MQRRTFLIWAANLSAVGLASCSPTAAAVAPSAQAVAPPLPNRDVVAESPNRAAVVPLPDRATGTPEIPAAPALPDRLQIPAINVDIPVVKLGWSRTRDRDGQIFSEWDVAEYAAGWHKNSALPGQGGNIVLSGHNNILGAVFRELDRLRQGHAVILWVGERRYDYTVYQVVILPELKATMEQRIANARWIGPFDHERLTLVSCWPRNNNTHRIVVVAKPQGAG